MLAGGRGEVKEEEAVRSVFAKRRRRAPGPKPKPAGKAALQASVDVWFAGQSGPNASSTGEKSRPTAAIIPVDNPYRSCRLIRSGDAGAGGGGAGLRAGGSPGVHPKATYKLSAPVSMPQVRSPPPAALSMSSRPCSSPLPLSKSARLHELRGAGEQGRWGR